MRTVHTTRADGGTIVVTYCARRGLLEFRQGMQKIPDSDTFTEKNLSKSEARQIAIQALAE